MDFFWSMVKDAGIPFSGVLLVGLLIGIVVAIKNPENKEED
jgi:hypothetical protein